MISPEALLLGRLAERFPGMPPSAYVGLRFQGEECDLSVAYDFDQAIRLRLAFKDAEEYEEAKERAEREAEDREKEAKRKRRRKGGSS